MVTFNSCLPSQVLEETDRCNLSLRQRTKLFCLAFASSFSVATSLTERNFVFSHFLNTSYPLQVASVLPSSSGVIMRNLFNRLSSQLFSQLQAMEEKAQVWGVQKNQDCQYWVILCVFFICVYYLLSLFPHTSRWPSLSLRLMQVKSPGELPTQTVGFPVSML